MRSRERDRGRLLLQPLLPGRLWPVAVKKYRVKPDRFRCPRTLAYDGTNLLLEAIRKAGSDDPRKIGMPSPRSGISTESPEIHARPERRQRQSAANREDRGGAAEVREDGEP